MKFINKPRKIVVEKEKNIIHLEWNYVEDAVSLFCKYFGRKIKFDSIFVLVRGGMVPAVMLSHKLNIRELEFYQGIKTYSNKPHDYGKFYWKYLPKLKSGKKFLVIEDIIFEGDTVNNAIRYIEKCGCSCVGVCSIVIDEKFKHLLAAQDNVIPLVSAYECENLKWIRFPWEKKLLKEYNGVIK